MLLAFHATDEVPDWNGTTIELTQAKQTSDGLKLND